MDISGGGLEVVLADDHHFFREGLRAMLTEDGISVVGEASDGAGAIALASELAPDVLVIDLQMPGPSGIEALREVVLSSPQVKVTVLSVSNDEAHALAALAAGACGYLLKDAQPKELVGAIRLVATGHAVLSPGLWATWASKAQADAAAARRSGDEVAFTKRELQILLLIAQGADNAAIGRELSISRHTVKQHVTNIFAKLGVQSRVQAAVYAVRTGLV